MEIKNNKKVIRTGKKVCLVTGILSGICGVYWLVKHCFTMTPTFRQSCQALPWLCFSLFLLRNVNMEKLKSVSPEIIDYVEREIIPRYSSFDKAHQENHVRMVIEHTE